MSGSGEHRSFAEDDDRRERTGTRSAGLSDFGADFIFDHPVTPLRKPASLQPDQTGLPHGAEGGRANPVITGLENAYCRLSPALSARRTFTVVQFILVVALLLATASGLYFDREATIVAGSILFSSFYLCVVFFRLGVLSAFRPTRTAKFGKDHPLPDGRYIVLVALYKEASQVAGLVRSLEALRWREGQKEIHLICESDDSETVSAAQALQKPHIRLHMVPDGKPRTKPRALNYVLQQVRGDYLVLYDAEDRPHPDQLIEAAEVFRKGGKTLACLQAPLSIDNRRESIMARFFAIEYDTLFRGILPVLAKWRAPIPLGGTSNHFRLPHLIAAGGWDSFNVTEDADLGIRLARCRLECKTLTLPTHEEAPALLHAWLRQRTRWIKGWLQTLLVHLRHPFRTWREMGTRRFFQFHMVLSAVVVSVLVHPFFLAAFFFQMIAFVQDAPQTAYGIWITAVSMFNLAAGYLSYGLLAWTVQHVRGSRGDKAAILFFPAYWLLISVAGWLAIAQLLWRPHYWSKTAHGSARRQTPAQRPATDPEGSVGPEVL